MKPFSLARSQFNSVVQAWRSLQLQLEGTPSPFVLYVGQNGGRSTWQGGAVTARTLILVPRNIKEPDQESNSLEHGRGGTPCRATYNQSSLLLVTIYH